MTFKELLSIVTDDTHVKAEVELKTPFGRKLYQKIELKIMRLKNILTCLTTLSVC